MALTREGIFYEVRGTGARTVVMLRGLGRSSRYWMGFEDLVAEDCRVILTDARGLGRSTKPMVWTDSVGDLADDVVCVLDELQIDRAHIFGISLGGMVALSLGLRQRDRVQSLAVLNSSVGNMRHFRASLGGALTMMRGGLQRRGLCAGLGEVLLSPAISREQRAETVAGWERLLVEEGLPIDTILKQLAAAARFSPLPGLRATGIPTLVVSGADDRFVPPGNSRIIAQAISGAEFVEVSQAGHELTNDQPAETLRVYRRFLKRLT